MHPNPTFRKTSRAQNIDFVASMGFGTLALADGQGAPLLSHIPFVLDGDEVLFHLVRSNPMVRLLSEPRVARLAVNGPHGYISPDWYGISEQVPTWNYIAVHLTGACELLPQERLREILEATSDRFEAPLAPKPVWKMDKMPDDVATRMMRQIVPCQLRIEAVDGTWKLSQNKPDEVRLAAAEGVAGSADGSELAALARWMRSPPEET
ncbi:MAG: FMN-binding negative transcriptional regulator [Sediminimonas sp.]|uniref:FMN-binding negative transcriptional regulator n=1 Tax=Sediminimonas sp. TaxID=2823379 RepID=UPI0028708EBE|nr:FMN-binding negative transcriptional regulator [Sediminimonas sp.]MDR9484906.1 FMN-binding negative transcriptional regulator [Sediminimonas sp.]